MISLDCHTWYNRRCHYILKTGNIRKCYIQRIVVDMGDCYVELKTAAGNIMAVSPVFIMAINCFHCNIDIMSDSDDSIVEDITPLPKLKITNKSQFRNISPVHQKILKRLLCETNRIRKVIFSDNRIEDGDTGV